MSRRKVIDTENQAVSMFETFYDRNPTKRVKTDFTWPKEMVEVGQARAQMYRSNKWKKNLSEYEEYKHIAEGYQACYAVPGFLREYNNPRKALKVHGDMVDVPQKMPKHFTVLAPLIGVQIQLYGSDGRLHGSKGLYEVEIARGMLGGARFPDNDEAFLFIYTNSGGVHMIITGEELEVEKDGIVG